MPLSRCRCVTTLEVSCRATAHATVREAPRPAVPANMPPPGRAARRAAFACHERCQRHQRPLSARVAAAAGCPENPPARPEMRAACSLCRGTARRSRHAAESNRQMIPRAPHACSAKENGAPRAACCLFGASAARAAREDTPARSRFGNTSHAVLSRCACAPLNRAFSAALARATRAPAVMFNVGERWCYRRWQRCYAASLRRPKAFSRPRRRRRAQRRHGNAVPATRLPSRTTFAAREGASWKASLN